ncbi:hypothetical protein QFZ32_000673 [Streptomyces canus]|nr:hypothetical protein [Streptomyces canus]
MCGSRCGTCSRLNRTSPISVRPGQTLIGDKNYFGRDVEQELTQQGIQLRRPTRKSERQWPGGSLFKPLRQVIESVNETQRAVRRAAPRVGRCPDHRRR